MQLDGNRTMTEEDFSKLAGVLDRCGKPSQEQVQSLYSFCLNLIDIIEDAQISPDVWRNTLGWE